MYLKNYTCTTVNYFVLTLFCLALFQVSMFGQVSTFQKLLTSTGTDIGYHVIETDEGYLIAGQSTAPQGDQDACLIHLDKNGNLLWQKTYGWSDVDKFTLVTKGNDGGFVAMGETRSVGNGGSDVLVVKTDENGSVQWTKTFGGAADDNAPVSARILNLADGYVLSGQNFSLPGSALLTSSYMIRLTNSGAIEWSNVYQSTNQGNYFVAMHAEGNVIYAGGGIEGDACFVRIDATNGQIIDHKEFGGNANESLYYLFPAADGSLILSDGTWSPYGGSRQDLWTVKLSKTGEVLWSKTYSTNGLNLRGSAIPTSDGGLIMAPYSQPALPNSNGYLIKTDGNGNIVWAKEYSTPNSQHFYKVIPTTDGGFFAIGRSEDGGVFHIYVVKTDADGLVPGCHTPEVSFTVGNFTPNTGSQTLSAASFFAGVSQSINLKNYGLSSDDFCTVGTGGTTSENSFPTVAPNPAFDRVRVAFNSTVAEGNLRLYDSFGRLVVETSVRQQDETFMDVSALACGTYFLDCFVSGSRSFHKVTVAH